MSDQPGSVDSDRPPTTVRELRARYKRSLLGWGWSLLKPIAFMLVNTFAFSVVLRAEPGAGGPERVGLVRVLPAVRSPALGFLQRRVGTAMEGVAHLCRQWSIDPSEVVTFGDNHNDAAMLAGADDAVALWIERLLQDLTR